ncbi:MAG: DUF192 domain-containing protein [candidate division KSB1 bacterium]|nr:DUF192 domain-containing protein [candidate division KSB1 bacterium]
MFRTAAIVISSLILVVAVLAYYLFDFGKPQAAKRTKVKIGAAEFEVEVAATAYLRTRGLSDRDFLPPDSGMLFIFPEPMTQTFWMKGMKFPLDIIWIRGDRIVGIEKNVPPEPGVSIFGLKLYTSPAAVDKVLEINAGLAEKYGLEIGDRLEL